MTDRQLKRIALGFRKGLLAGRSSQGMCFAVSAPLQGLLSACGVDTEVVEAHFPEINHFWLRLPDGRIIDATADQFGLEPVYVGPLPLQYSVLSARLVDAVDPHVQHRERRPRAKNHLSLFS